MEPADFVTARLDERTTALEKEIDGQIEQATADGVGMTREEFFTPDPPTFPRRLRELEAMRRIVADRWGGPDHQDVWEHHVRLLAAIDHDHPDYDPSWAPEDLNGDHRA